MATVSRVLVRNILSSLASGETITEVIEDFPNISKEDILTALEFGSELSSFKIYSYEKYNS